MKIVITQEMIDNGRGGARAFNCPIAQAIKQATGSRFACVTGENWHTGPYGRSGKMTKAGRKFQVRFDKFWSAKPCTMILPEDK